MPFAGVLTSATVVADYATTLPLAVILAFTIMLRRGDTPAVTLTGILACTPAVAAVAASLSFTFVQTLAGVTIASVILSGVRNAQLRPRKNSSNRCQQKLAKIASTDFHV